MCKAAEIFLRVRGGYKNRLFQRRRQQEARFQHPPVEAPEQLKAPVAKLVTVVTVMVGLLLAAVTLNYYYRSQRNGRALRYFQTGNEFVHFNNVHAFQCMSRSHHPS